MTSTTHGRAQVTDLEAAVERDGTITALRMRVTANLGAYPVFTFIPDLTLMMGIGVYHVKNIDLRATCVFTNSTTVAAYRGAGRPEAAYYLERFVDIIAAELGLPPEAVRRKNFIPPSAFPYAAPTGQNYDSGEYDRALTKALEIARVKLLRDEQKQRVERGDRKLLGVGMACYVEMCGFGPFESAVVRVEPGGDVTAYTGTSPHGQGHETTFAQIIADKLGVDFDRDRRAPRGHAEHAHGQRHRGQPQPGRRWLGHSAGRRHGPGQGAPHRRDHAGGRAGGRRDGERALPGARGAEQGAHARRHRRQGLRRRSAGRHPLGAGGDGLLPPAPARLSVRRPRGRGRGRSDTGVVTVRDYISVDDCGVRISPLIVTGQVHGGLAQGIAQALLEEVIYGRDGQLLTGTLMDYAIPRADDLPFFTPIRR